MQVIRQAGHPRGLTFKGAVYIPPGLVDSAKGGRILENNRAGVAQW